MREPPGLGLGSQVTASEGMNAESVSRGLTSPLDIRGILDAIPDITGPAGQGYTINQSLYDDLTANLTRTGREGGPQGGRETLRDETPRVRPRAGVLHRNSIGAPGHAEGSAPRLNLSSREPCPRHEGQQAPVRALRAEARGTNRCAGDNKVCHSTAQLHLIPSDLGNWTLRMEGSE